MAVIAVLVFGFLCVPVLWVAWHRSEYNYWQAYHRAQRLDLEYYRSHPGCMLSEAHQHRDRVMKRYGRY